MDWMSLLPQFMSEEKISDKASLLVLVLLPLWLRLNKQARDIKQEQERHAKETKDDQARNTALLKDEVQTNREHTIELKVAFTQQIEMITKKIEAMESDQHVMKEQMDDWSKSFTLIHRDHEKKLSQLQAELAEERADKLQLKAELAKQDAYKLQLKADIEELRKYLSHRS